MPKHFKFLSKIVSPEYAEQVDALIVELGLVPSILVPDEAREYWNRKFHQMQHSQSLSELDKEIRDEFMEYFVEQYHHRKKYYEDKDPDNAIHKQLSFGI